MVITLIHEFEIDMDQISIFMWNTFQNFSVKLVGIKCSITQKTSQPILFCYASSTGADVFAVTETWFSEFDVAHRTEATPPGFKLIDHTRDGRRGGGTTLLVLLVKDSLYVKKVDAGEKSSSEYSE